MRYEEVEFEGSIRIMEREETTVSHFRLFGFLCYKHICDARTKLQDKSEAIILIGYDNELGFGY